MGTQISIKFSKKMFETAKKYTEKHGFDTLQDLIRETLREKLFERERMTSFATMKASEPSLAMHWLTKKEDDAWKHLQEET